MPTCKDCTPVCTLEDGVMCSPYAPQDQVAVTMTAEDWGKVLHSLEDAANSHRARATSWRCSCNDKKMGAETAARYEYGAQDLERLAKNIDSTIYPMPPKPETE